MKKTHYFAVVIAFLTGCASMTMKGYVGQTVADVIGEYGMPSTAFDMPDGTRAFVWQMGMSSTYGGSTQTTGTYSSTTTASASAYGNNASGVANTSGNIFAETYTAPTFTVSSKCAYMLYAKKSMEIDSPAAWVITGFKKPRLECE
jgi:hypothetical protein